jgi:catalase-peroxidase
MSENHDPVVAEGPTPEAAECPVLPGRVHPTAGDANSEWWPRRLNLKILAKNPAVSNPWARISTTPRHSTASTWPR